MIDINELDLAGEPAYVAPDEYVVPTSQSGPREAVKTGRYTLAMSDGKLKDQNGDRHPIIYRMIGTSPNQALETQFAVKVIGGDYDGRLIYVRQTTFSRDRKVKVGGVEKAVKSNDTLDIIRAIGDKSDITKYSEYVVALAAGIARESSFSGWIDLDVWCKGCGYKLKGAKNFPLDDSGNVMSTFACPGNHDGEEVIPTLAARNTLAFASPVR